MDRPDLARDGATGSRDRAGFVAPALATALFNPLPWLLLVGANPNGPFRGFGGWAALDDLGVVLLVGAVPAVLGWVFASRVIFGVLAWGGLVCWLWWAACLHHAHWVLTVAWPGLSAGDRAIASLLVLQLLGYPAGFWFALRNGMRWDRPGSHGTSGSD